MRAGRVGDEAKCPEDGHKCPSCKHVTVGPAIKGSPDVYINNQPTLRIGDRGMHTDKCCGANAWRAMTGSSTVTVNGLPVHRMGDETKHCGGLGRLIIGSPDVNVGDGGEGADSTDEEGSVDLEVTDAFDRPLEDVTVRVLSPEGVIKEVKFDGHKKLDGLPKGATVIVEKTLQKSKADRPAVKGIVPKGERMVTPRKKPAAPPAAKPAAGASSGGGSKGAPAKTAPKPPAPPAKPAKPADDGPRKAHVPASNGTSKDPAITTIPRPRGEKVRITQFTVHNWVEAVYKAFKVPFPTGVREMATLGVREASMQRRGQGVGDIKETERLAEQGKTSAEGGKGTARQARVKRIKSVDAAPTIWDDTLYVVWTESKVNKDQRVDVFQCTIDPQTTSKRGQPYLLEGREYEMMPHWHQIDGHAFPNPHGGGPNQAFKIKDKGTRGAGKIRLVRTYKKRFVTSRADLRYPESIVNISVPSKINMHFGSPREYVGGASQGCTVLRHTLPSGRYGHFVRTIVHK
ncbi:MAG TPA: PAAR domain-containing protein, partial [Polyangiaceae bacterium]|nr:PAAR domain-containing protein [Polyangiaceae bacterium]